MVRFLQTGLMSLNSRAFLPRNRAPEVPDVYDLVFKSGLCYEVCILPANEHRMEKVDREIIVENGTESILFIDDEAYLAEVGKEMLEDYGYSVVSLTSSTEACELFEQEPGRFDLVITDYTMPEMTGAQLARRINQANAEVPVIMCTGITLEPGLLEGITLKQILMKPLDMDALLTAVRTSLDK